MEDPSDGFGEWYGKSGGKKECHEEKSANIVCGANVRTTECPERALQITPGWQTLVASPDSDDELVEGGSGEREQRLLQRVTVRATDNPRAAVALHDWKGKGKFFKSLQSETDGVASAVELLIDPRHGRCGDDVTAGDLEHQTVTGTDGTHRRLPPTARPDEKRAARALEATNGACRQDHEMFHGLPRGLFSVLSRQAPGNERASG